MASTAARRSEVRQWSTARLVALVAAVLATAVSTYLTIEHYTGSSSLACPENAAFNCAKVTTSSWSVVAGVPVAVAGLAFYVVLTAALLVSSRSAMWQNIRTALAVIGMATVVYLVAVELLAVDALCLWCTAVHVLTVIVLAAVLWDRTSPA